jgi:hypothetical protein
MISTWAGSSLTRRSRSVVSVTARPIAAAAAASVLPCASRSSQFGLRLVAPPAGPLVGVLRRRELTQDPVGLGLLVAGVAGGELVGLCRDRSPNGPVGDADDHLQGRRPDLSRTLERVAASAEQQVRSPALRSRSGANDPDHQGRIWRLRVSLAMYRYCTELA